MMAGGATFDGSRESVLPVTLHSCTPEFGDVGNTAVMWLLCGAFCVCLFDLYSESDAVLLTLTSQFSTHAVKCCELHSEFF